MSDDPRLDPHFDSRMSGLISDAVADVEPRDGIQAIRSRTRPSNKENPMATSRNWLFAVGGAIVGTAAVILAITVVANLNDDGDGSTPVANPSTATSDATDDLSASSSPSDSVTPSETSTPIPTEDAVAVYFVGDGPGGPVLFREFQPGIGGEPVTTAASLGRSLVRRSTRTIGHLWPAGTQATASYDGDVVTVDLTGAALHDRPKGMSKTGRRARRPAGHLQRAGCCAGAGARAVPARRPARRHGARAAVIRAAGQRPCPRDALADVDQ